MVRYPSSPAPNTPRQKCLNSRHLLPQHWYPAAAHMAKCARQMCRVLWVPQTEAEGVPYEKLCAIIQALDEWRVEHLERVGMPNFANFAAQNEWGFLEAVSMCKLMVSLRISRHKL